ncbi:uncharacterized protein N0V89_006989 [Didymosphaeria variabile]|uniref:Uncharacterized protein n=1 Tax=Didymosphaeria variabile TaxID=1932322 RepID=A0A9W8XJ93_9PLEO|nr:uncharacterized protein N0V89_006989 [Didymosphaeria variabile]KAJ4351646.1 hypothetical protein N0V89_006989 [Didymosphaeria variabile]
MSDNSTTPRNKRLSNGPGPSSADKYPEDSPTRLRHPPRFPTAMRGGRRHDQPRRLQQQAELHVEDTEAWPTPGAASKQSRSERRKASRSLSTVRPARSSSTSTSDSETAMAQQLVSSQPDTDALSPEQRDVIEAEVIAYRQRLLQQHTPTRIRPEQQPQSTYRAMSVPERNLFQPRPAPYSAYQAVSAQQGSAQRYNQQHADQQTHESRAEMVPTCPPFVPESQARLEIAQQQQQLTTQQQQQASPFRAFGPGVNLAYNFDRLAASQQAQREATVAQLHSAFFEPQSTHVQPASAANIGHQAYNAQPGPYTDYSRSQSYNITAEAPAAATPGFYRPVSHVLTPNAQGYTPQPETSTRANATHGRINPVYLPVFDAAAQESSTQTDALATMAASVNTHGYINPAYLPVFDTIADERSTHTGALTTKTSAPEPAFTADDYETTPPPSPSVTMLDLLNRNARDRLTPDNRPLTPKQEAGTCYGIEIGGLGVSTFGTSDRTDWLPSPWNPTARQQEFRVRPLDHDGWGGWEWAMKKGWGNEDGKK